MSTATEVDTSWWTAEFSKRISHKVLFWTDAGCWIQARNLVEASKIARILGIVERISGTEPFRKILDQSIRLRLSRVIAMFCRAECFDDGALPSASVSHVLFDITESRKAYFVRLKPLFENDAKLFSILQGANLFNLEDFHSTGKHERQGWEHRTIVFMHSASESSAYKNAFGIPSNHLQTTGVPRHHPDWIANLDSHATNRDDNSPRRSILVISRPADTDFLPPERRRQYLQEIKQVALSYDLKVVVKLHPKERGLQDYFAAFGKHNPERCGL